MFLGSLIASKRENTKIFLIFSASIGKTFILRYSNALSKPFLTQKVVIINWYSSKPLQAQWVPGCCKKHMALEHSFDNYNIYQPSVCVRQALVTALSFLRRYEVS
jgi:hypothetical protein